MRRSTLRAPGADSGQVLRSRVVCTCVLCLSSRLLVYVTPGDGSSADPRSAGQVAGRFHHGGRHMADWHGRQRKQTKEGKKRNLRLLLSPLFPPLIYFLLPSPPPLYPPSVCLWPAVSSVRISIKPGCRGWGWGWGVVGLAGGEGDYL